MDLVVFCFILGQRVLELFWSNSNTKRLLVLGAQEYDRENYRWMVLFHTAWVLTLGIGVFTRSQHSPENTLALTLFVFIEVFRIWVLGTLGQRWTTRIIKIPHEIPITSGPYRWIRHPNYLVVVSEIFIVPLIYNFWSFSLIGSLLHLPIIFHRIKRENLAWHRVT